MVWPRTVGILGAGAMGTLFAHGLAGLTDVSVTLLARSPGPPWAAVEGRGRVPVRRVSSPPAHVDHGDDRHGEEGRPRPG